MTDPNNNNSKIDSLFAAARRAEHYDPTREYGFETRVMSRIRAERETKMPFILWAWRLTPFFVSIVILLGIWISAFESSKAIDLSAADGIRNEEIMIATSLSGE